MRFSVIIPTYNRCRILKETVDSVLNQTFKDFELIVVDDGSADDTRQVLAAYGSKIRVVNRLNGGGARARDAGAEIARGEYLSFLDDDDLFLPHTLDVYNRLISDGAPPKLIIGQPVHFETASGPVTIPNSERVCFRQYTDYFSKDITLFTTCSMLVVERKAFFEIGGFGDSRNLKYHLHDDFRFLLNAGGIGPVTIVTEPKQFCYRVHATNSVKNLSAVLIAVDVLVTDERAGVFDGRGRGRKTDRYALIGSTAFFWCKKAIRQREIYSSLKLLLRSSPMISVSVWRFSMRKFRRRAMERVL